MDAPQRVGRCLAQETQKLVQQPSDDVAWRVAVQEAGDTAEEVAEEIPPTPAQQYEIERVVCSKCAAVIAERRVRRAGT